MLLPEIIEHVYNSRVLADEAWRVAKKRLIITTPTQKHDDPDHKRWFPIEGMREFLKPYGEAKFHGLTITGERTEDINKIYFQIVIVEKGKLKS